MIMTEITWCVQVVCVDSFNAFGAEDSFLCTTEGVVPDTRPEEKQLHVFQDVGVSLT